MLFILILLGLMLMAMPKGFDMTHEQIGSGKPALVFVYDPNLAVSISQPEQMNIVRDQLGDSMHFLIAKIATPAGDKLIADYNAKAAELLMFDGSGKLVKRAFALKKSAELMQWLKRD